MKSQAEIELNKCDIENSGIKLDAYMSGYLRALKWVLGEDVQ